MYYILMNKDTQVAYCKDNKIIKLIRDDMLPIGSIKLKKGYDISFWLNKRQIPTTRSNYIKIAQSLKSENIDINEFKYLHFGASLTDTFWMFPVTSFFSFSKYVEKKKKSKSKSKSKKPLIPKYSDVKYYEKEAKDGLLQAISENKPINREMCDTVPDNVTNGDTMKYWTYRNKNYYLVKQNSAENDKTAEKIIISQLLMDTINHTRFEINEKKKNIETAEYVYEAGDIPSRSCCYSKCFTDEITGLTSLEDLEVSLEKTLTIDELIEYLALSDKDLKDYFDFIILFDFITENRRKKSDILFMINNSSNKIMRPAPLTCCSTCFPYIEKDYTRIYKKDDIGTYVNVFGMTPDEQLEYLANIKWIDYRELFRNLSEFKDLLENDIDKRQLTLLNLETICNAISHKLQLIEYRKYEIAEESGELNNRSDDDSDDDYDDSYDDDDDDDYGQDEEDFNV